MQEIEIHETTICIIACRSLFFILPTNKSILIWPSFGLREHITAPNHIAIIRKYVGSSSNPNDEVLNVKRMITIKVIIAKIKKVNKDEMLSTKMKIILSAALRNFFITRLLSEKSPLSIRNESTTGHKCVRSFLTGKLCL